MFKKLLDLIVAHVKAELVAWAEAELAQHLSQTSPVAAVPLSPDSGPGQDVVAG